MLRHRASHLAQARERGGVSAPMSLARRRFLEFLVSVAAVHPPFVVPATVHDRVIVLVAGSFVIVKTFLDFEVVEIE